MLEQFWRGLKRRDIYAEASTRWRNPQARLLEGDAWTAVRADVLTTLALPGDPDALLPGTRRRWTPPTRGAGGRLAVNTEVSIDDAGKIHLTEGEASAPSCDCVYLVTAVSPLTQGHNRLLRPLPAVDQPQALPASGRPCAPSTSTSTTTSPAPASAKPRESLA